MPPCNSAVLRKNPGNSFLIKSVNTLKILPVFYKKAEIFVSTPQNFSHKEKKLVFLPNF